jgi:penicillin-binding protein 2
MAAPMVRSFFEPIKDDIKDIIAPPQRALVVTAETEATATAGTPDKPAAADDAVHPLRALPVEDPAPADKPPRPRPPRPARALPVTDDEVMDENIEEP